MTSDGSRTARVAKMKATQREKQARWLNWQCGAIEIQEYEHGFRLLVPGRPTAYFAGLDAVLASRRLRDHLTLRGTDEERAGIAQLKREKGCGG